jgi:hypothetical protein
VLWVTLARTLIPIARRRVASGSLPQFERAACWRSFIDGYFRIAGDGIMAELDPSLFSRPVDRVSLIAAGTSEQTRNRRPTADRTRWSG